jgi:hypothetical protein
MNDGKEIEVEESDSIRSGVTLPYSPEFADLESNTNLLDQLADMTGGMVYDETDKALADAVQSGQVFRRSNVSAQSPQAMWYWLVMLAGVGLFFDVAVRRIAVEPAEASAAAVKLWERLRGRADAAASSPQFIERLKNRKAQVEETLGRSTRRFEAGEERAAPSPVATADTMATNRPAPPPQPRPAAPASQPQEDDAFARLMKAKKKALGDRDAGDEPERK